MKKTLVFLSVLMLMLALCSCGKEASPVGTHSPTEVTQAPSVEVTQTPTEAATKATTKPATKATAKPTTKPTPKPTTCNHSYSNATCTAPKTCTKCGATTGKATGHNWKAATCTDPNICTQCGITNGEARGHTWSNATCTDAKKCSMCNQAEGSPLGHNYVEGVCSRCSEKDSNYVKTYSAGETWTVPGAFELTINAVTRHYICDDTYKEDYGKGYTSAVIIDYTYKNIGSEKLEINENDLEIYDASGTEAESSSFEIWCDHGIESKMCITGGSCNAKLPVAIVNDGDSITIYVEQKYLGEYQKASFKISVSEPSEEEVQTQKGYSQVKGEFTYKYNDFVGTRGDSGAKVLFIPKDTALKEQDNDHAMMLMPGKYNNGIVVKECDGYGKFDTGEEVITAGEYVVIVVSGNTNDAGKFTADQLRQHLGDYISDADLETLSLFIGFRKCAIDTMELKKGYVHTISNDFGITYF